MSGAAGTRRRESLSAFSFLIPRRLGAFRPAPSVEPAASARPCAALGLRGPLNRGRPRLGRGAGTKKPGRGCPRRAFGEFCLPLGPPGVSRPAPAILISRARGGAPGLLWPGPWPTVLALSLGCHQPSLRTFPGSGSVPFSLGANYQAFHTKSKVNIPRSNW